MTLCVLGVKMASKMKKNKTKQKTNINIFCFDVWL